MWSQSLRNVGCIHLVSAVFWYALLWKASPVSAPTAVPCATIISQITEMKLLFTWLVYFATFLLPLSAVLVIQNVGQILKMTSECNTRRIIKDLTWIHSWTLYLKYTIWKLLRNMHNKHGSGKILLHDTSSVHKTILWTLLYINHE